MRRKKVDAKVGGVDATGGQPLTTVTGGDKENAGQLTTVCAMTDDEDGEALETRAEGEQEQVVSLHSVAGQQAITLADSGTSLNFVGEDFARTLQREASPTTPIVVRVANGAPMRCTWMYRDLSGIRYHPRDFVAAEFGSNHQ
ncbi:unnamed protein product [Linum trigynum]|uniref:Uncharacterized protein n=1 Tax=Linum trigynum TaxID=586398 RepID=A0AAV2EX59_9ROSI